MLAHILVCFLAYVLWKFLGQLCTKSGLGDEPRRIFAELGEVRVVDVVLTTRDGQELRQRCITQPTEHQRILLHHLLHHLGWQLPNPLLPNPNVAPTFQSRPLRHNYLRRRLG